MSLHVRVAEGNATEAARTFVDGTPQGPFGVGLRGDWAIAAPSIAAVHAYLYFDGHALFVATAQGDVPTLVNGAPAGGSWTAVTAPSEVRLGGARLLVSDAAEAHAPLPMPPQFEDAPTNAQPEGPAPISEDVATTFYQGGAAAHLAASKPLPQPAPLPAAAPPPAAGKPQRPDLPRPSRDAEVSVATRFLPIEQMRKDAPPPAAGAPAAPLPAAGAPPPMMGAPPGMPMPAVPGAPPMGAPPGMMPPGMPVPGMPGAPPPGMPYPGMPPAADKTGPAAVVGKPSPLDPVKKAWREAPLPRKILVVLAPLGLVGFLFVMFGGESQTRPANAQSKTSASASAATSASAAAPEEAAPVGSGDSAIGPLVQAGGPPPAPSGYTTPARAPKSVEKTTERNAVDAVAAGNFAEALKLYEQLASEHPDVPAYQEAVRILKAKR